MSREEQLIKNEKNRFRVLAYITCCITKKSCPPSVREICDNTDIRSSSTVHRLLTELENDGYIVRDKKKSRAIYLPIRG